MGMEEFEDMMPHEVTVEAFKSRNSYDVATYYDPIRYRARVVLRRRAIKRANGDETVSTTTIWVSGSTGIGENDRITLPDPFAPTQPKILAVERLPDEAGHHHEVIFT